MYKVIAVRRHMLCDVKYFLRGRIFASVAITKLFNSFSRCFLILKSEQMLDTLVIIIIIFTVTD